MQQHLRPQLVLQPDGLVRLILRFVRGRIELEWFYRYLLLLRPQPLQPPSSI